MSTKPYPYYQDIDGFRITGAFSPEAYKTGLRYKPGPDDLFIATFPKCGTTWVQQIVTLLFNEGKPVKDFYEFNSRTPFLEMAGAESVENMKRPGSIKTHLPFHMVPYSPATKYIYVVRNPKDALVSFYHHTRSYLYKYEDGDFNDYFKIFLNGENDFGDYFDHVLGWYEHRNDPNVMFFTYEELKEDTSKTVKKIGRFMGGKYADSVEEEKLLADVLKYSSIDYMKTVLNDSLEAISENAHSSTGDAGPVSAGTKYFLEKLAELKTSEAKPFELIRKGIVGGWRKNFTEDQNRRMDQRLKEKLGNTELYAYWTRIKCV